MLRAAEEAKNTAITFFPFGLGFLLTKQLFRLKRYYFGGLVTRLILIAVILIRTLEGTLHRNLSDEGLKQAPRVYSG